MTPCSPRHLLLTTDSVGGVWSYSLDLARALARRGVTVELAVLGPDASASQAVAVQAVAGVRLHNTGLPLDWTAPDRDTLLLASAAVAAMARAHAVDVVQLHTPALVGECAWPAPVVAVVHSCVGTWWDAVRGGAPPQDFEWRMEAVRAGLRTAEAVVSPTQALADRLAGVYATSRKIDIIHNGRDPASRNRLSGMPRLGVLTAGRLWDEGKNVAILNAAASSLGAIPVSAAGANRGPHGGATVLGSITLLGLLDDTGMADTLAAARIFASPALYEPFGLAVLEAAQAELPLVLSDIASFRELWDGAALFLPAQDWQAWANTLASLHAQPLECAHLGRKASARAQAYTVARFEDAMWSLYDRLLSPSSQASAA